MNNELLNKKKNKIITSIEEDYFYGIDLEKGIITGFKGVNDYNKEIMEVYNNSDNKYEKLFFSVLLENLKIEKEHLKDEIKKSKNEKEIYISVNNFLKANGEYFASFTNDLLKEINLSVEKNESANIFAKMSSVTDALSCIYFLCIYKAKEIIKNKEKTREENLINALLDRYLSLAEEYLPKDSKEYDIAKKQHSNMTKYARSVEINEFINIFLVAFHELQRDIENLNKKDKKVK